MFCRLHLQIILTHCYSLTVYVCQENGDAKGMVCMLMKRMKDDSIAE